MLAYRSGIFPMADSRDDPDIFWIEPRLRAIIPLDGLHVSHSLARTLRRNRFTVTCNEAFSMVMDACAAPRPARSQDECLDDDDDEGGSWISHRIQRSYENLHRLGLAHSIECWRESADGTARELVGGLYGVGFDRAFCGESMFSTTSDSSKVALCWLVAAMRRGGATLLDCQFMTPHLASLGAQELPQKDYLKLLHAAQSGEPGDQFAPLSPSGAGTGSVSAASSTGSASEGALSLPDAFAALLEDAAAAGLSSSPGKFIAQALTQTS